MIGNRGLRAAIWMCADDNAFWTNAKWNFCGWNRRERWNGKCWKENWEEFSFFLAGWVDGCGWLRAGRKIQTIGECACYDAASSFVWGNDKISFASPWNEYFADCWCEGNGNKTILSTNMQASSKLQHKSRTYDQHTNFSCSFSCLCSCHICKFTISVCPIPPEHHSTGNGDTITIAGRSPL